MSTKIWEFFGYSSEDWTPVAIQTREQSLCPFIAGKCTKTLNNGDPSGVCSLKPARGDAVICCPNRLYAEDYRILRDVVDMTFGKEITIYKPHEAISAALRETKKTVAVFGKKWGGELPLPKKSKGGSYYVDWVLVLLNPKGAVEEFVAVEVQTIDTTGNYRGGISELRNNQRVVRNSAGFNWENVNKRILPQLIYKGQLLQRESKCKKGIFFICPHAIYTNILKRLSSESGLVAYDHQPGAITFLTYDLDQDRIPGEPIGLQNREEAITTVDRLQYAFNNVVLPEKNVYETAINKALRAHR